MADQDDRDEGDAKESGQQYKHACNKCNAGWTDNRDNCPFCPDDVRHGQMTTTEV